MVITNIYPASSPTSWEKWESFNSKSTYIVDHKLWNDFLINNLSEKNGINLVKYGKVDKKNYNYLDTYINYLTSIIVTNLNKDEQKSYWINLYNALTIKVILDNYPVKSIRNINISGLFKIGPWDKKLLVIESEEVSLNDIEHRILRPIWNDLRVHYALNCASKSCPELQKVAFTPSNIESLLVKAESKYLNSSYGYKVENKAIVLSSIYNWFDIDFGKNEEEVLDYIKSVIDIDEYKKIKYDYDWTLNEY